MAPFVEIPTDLLPLPQAKSTEELFRLIRIGTGVLVGGFGVLVGGFGVLVGGFGVLVAGFPAWDTWNDAPDPPSKKLMEPLLAPPAFALARNVYTFPLLV